MRVRVGGLALRATERYQQVSTRMAKSRVDLLEEITPDVERLYNRHMQAPRLWYPHEQINWGEGEDFGEHAWAPEQYPIGDGVRIAPSTSIS